jgi:uncharacterized membrane protein
MIHTHDHKRNCVQNRARSRIINQYILNRTDIRNKFNILEKKVAAEDKDEYPVKKIEPANQPEFRTPHSKKKLPLPTDLQEVIDIIRGQGG